MKMKKRVAVLLVAVAGLLFSVSWQRYAQHQAWLQERQTTAHQCREMGTALMKEAILASNQESTFDVKDGCARYTLTADEGELIIVMDDKTQELMTMVLRTQFDPDATRQLTVFHQMLSYAGIEAADVWKNESGAEVGNDPAEERVDMLYAHAESDVLIRNGYRITVQTDDSNSTEIIFRKHNAQLWD